MLPLWRLVVLLPPWPLLSSPVALLGLFLTALNPPTSVVVVRGATSVAVNTKQVKRHEEAEGRDEGDARPRGRWHNSLLPNTLLSLPGRSSCVALLVNTDAMVMTAPDLRRNVEIGAGGSARGPPLAGDAAITASAWAPPGSWGRASG